MATSNPLTQLGDQGVSVWVDSIARDGLEERAARGADLLDPELAASRLNPNYRDVLYCEELIGRDTVNTAPQHGCG